MSAELQWMCIRNSSCFLVKKNCGIFSSEPNNLANKHSYKYSMVRRKAVGMRSAGDKGVELLTKRVKYVRRPKTLFVATRLSRDRRRVYRTIRRKLGKTGYRRDLIEPAVRRASAILASQRPRKIKTAKKA